jgi:hypothetical protein
MDDHLVLAAWAVDETGTIDASFCYIMIVK